MKLIELQVDGKRERVLAQIVEGSLWVHRNGHTYSVPLEQRRSRAQETSGPAGSGNIKAPMPGKVIKVMTQTGATVAKGDVLVVMEAMKMEYSLEADQDGDVVMVDVVEGQQVVLGELMVKIEAGSES